MNHYENVVHEYLRADRAVFFNSQYCIQLYAQKNPDTSGPHWYCDAIALDFRSETIFLCEISYATGLSDLLARLESWNEYWDKLRVAIVRDSFLLGKPVADWKIKPWLFVREKHKEHLEEKLKLIANRHDTLKFDYKITSLEDAQPWNFCSWNRSPDDEF